MAAGFCDGDGCDAALTTDGEAEDGGALMAGPERDAGVAWLFLAERGGLRDDAPGVRGSLGSRGLLGGGGAGFRALFCSGAGHGFAGLAALFLNALLGGSAVTGGFLSCLLGCFFLLKFLS